MLDNDRLGAVTVQLLRYLRAAADASSFGEAADEVGVSLSALSQGLARIEEVLGVSLFEPVGRGRRLTPAGAEAAAYAREVLAATDGLAERLHEQAAGRSGRLRVGMIDAAALYLAASAVEAFRDALPGVDMQITVGSSGELLERLRSYRDDLAIVVDPAPGTDARALWREEMLLFGPGGDTADFVLYPSGSHTRARIDAGLANAGIQPNVIAESPNPSVQAQLARLMRTRTVLPAPIASAVSWAERGPVIAERTIVAALRPGREPGAITMRFIDGLEEHTTSPPATTGS